MVHAAPDSLAFLCIIGQESDASAATQSPSALQTMNSGAMIMTSIHFTFRHAAASPLTSLGSGTLRSCTVHVQRKMVASELQRMVRVEQTFTPET
jgi:hypothetical protein